jgi:glycerate dehydrogenase
VKVHERTATESVVDRSRGAEILLTNKTVLTAEHFEQSPELRYIGVLATGFNVVDVAAASQRGIVVTNVPTYGTVSVAQLVFAHLLNWCHHVDAHARSVRDGKWCDSIDFCFADYPLIELAGKTMGLIGFGRIGQATARLALAFDMNVLAFDPGTENRPWRVWNWPVSRCFWRRAMWLLCIVR